MSSHAGRAATHERSRRLAVVALAALAVVGALVAVGRWERQRWIDGQLRGMARTRALVGPLQQPALSGYRVQASFDCLVYRRGPNPYALELCFDSAGRLVETIDRRRYTRRISSLTTDPAAATIRVPRSEVVRLLHMMGARV